MLRSPLFGFNKRVNGSDNVNDMLHLQELRREVEVMDARGTRGEGQRLVARAWLDPGFKKRLLQ
eukprot:gene80-235_t